MADSETADRKSLLSRVTGRATDVVMDAVDPDEVLDRIDVNALLDRVDPNALLDRVDPNKLLDRVDPNALLDRVDPNALLDRVDVDRLMNRVDVDALLDRVDVERLVDRAGIADIVRESTGALAGSALDVFRRQLVALDQIVGRTTFRMIGRDPKTRPQFPADLEVPSGTDEGGRGQVTGHFAGPITRLVAFAADVLVVWMLMILIGVAVAFVGGLFGYSLDEHGAVYGTLALLTFGTLVLVYGTASYAIAGKTVGMSVLGLRVLGHDGGGLNGWAALRRTFVLPFSVLVFGLGCIGIITSPERRTLHDVAANSVVVYDWGDRPAEMPAPITQWIDQHGGVEDSLVAGTDVSDDG